MRQRQSGKVASRITSSSGVCNIGSNKPGDAA
jgi:hypothetical protein